MQGKSSVEMLMHKPQPLVKQTLSEQIYAHLKDDIIQHRVGFGEKLVNRELQQRFGVSSTPVRDAINHLYQDGLLEDITNGGARVISFDHTFAKEVNEVSMVLVRGAIDAIIREGRLGQLADLLREILDKKGLPSTVEEYTHMNALFHRAFLVCCGNAHLAQLYSQMTVQFEMLVHLVNHHNSVPAPGIMQFRKIYECCCAGDGDGLQKTMHQYYTDVADWFVKNAGAFER